MDPLLQLAQFAAELTSSRIPAAALQRARLARRDVLGCMIGGATTPAGLIASRAATANPGSAPIAAFAAAVHASALDFDDGHYAGGAIHPSSVIVPCVLLAARGLGAVSEQQFTTAQIVGYEIGLRAAHLLWPRHELDDYHCTGTAATLGAAAAVATLRGLDADGIARAIAIAWAHAPMSTFQLPMVKESIGWSATTAMFAADLAAQGFMRMTSGGRSALADTFPPTPFHRAGAMDDPFVSSLGATFETEHIYFKSYAACRYTHTALRSLAELMSTEGVTADDTESIRVFTPRASMNLTDTEPGSLEHAQYSFPFVLASMLLTGAAGADEISEADRHDPARLALAARVSVHHDPALDPTYPAHYGSRIEVRTRDGRRHEMTRLVAPGDPADPLSEDELATKFTRLAAGIHGAGAADVAAALMSVDAADCVAVIDQALAPDDVGAGTPGR